MEMSVYLFVEIGFMALLRLIYHFCRILFADSFLQNPFCRLLWGHTPFCIPPPSLAALVPLTQGDIAECG